MDTASLSTATFYLGIIVGFLAGVAFAIARRALADLRGAKAAVPKARKTFWSSAWDTAKIGTLVLAGILLFGWWVIQDATGGEHPLAPAPAGAGSPSPSPSRTKSGR